VVSVSLRELTPLSTCCVGSVIINLPEKCTRDISERNRPVYNS
jgi:hypothetical protein